MVAKSVNRDRATSVIVSRIRYVLIIEGQGEVFRNSNFVIGLQNTLAGVRERTVTNEYAETTRSKILLCRFRQAVKGPGETSTIVWPVIQAAVYRKAHGDRSVDVGKLIRFVRPVHRAQTSEKTDVVRDLLRNVDSFADFHVLAGTHQCGIGRGSRIRRSGDGIGVRSHVAVISIDQPLYRPGVSTEERRALLKLNCR
jgi:hypothetical protein